jgi:hypothetical protein
MRVQCGRLRKRDANRVHMQVCDTCYAQSVTVLRRAGISVCHRQGSEEAGASAIAEQVDAAAALGVHQVLYLQCHQLEAAQGAGEAQQQGTVPFPGQIGCSIGY